MKRRRLGIGRRILCALAAVALVCAWLPLAPGALQSAFAEGEGETIYAQRLYLQYDTPDSAGQRHYLGEDFDSAYKTLHINSKGQTVQLNGWYTTNTDSTTMLQTAATDTQLGVITLGWSSSDNSVATVSAAGVVTPRANGTVNITCTITDASKYEGSAPSKTVTIVFDGQEGEYVGAVDIIDKDGNTIGENWGGVTVIAGENTFLDLYARVTWVDADGNTTKTESTLGGSVSSTVSWATSNGDLLYINEDTGRAKSYAYSGNVFVTCSVVGGVGGAIVQDSANIQIDTGKYEYDPAQSLKLTVVYEEMPDTEVAAKELSYGELASQLPSYTYNYTLIGGSGSTSFATLRATGFMFKDVLNLLKVDINDINTFEFVTADGYNNPVTYKLLYESGDRYYFPNWDVSSKSGAQVVPPMLACANAMTWGQGSISPDKALDEGNRFRLVFGCLWDTSVTTTAYQIYYIHGIKIVLKGAPPADPNGGTGTGGSGDGNGGGGTGVGGGEGGIGQGIGSDAKTAADGGEGGIGEGGGSGKQWRIYQMMSKAQTDLDPLADDVPLWPAIPVSLLALAIGAAATVYSYRKRRGLPVPFGN